MSEHEDEMVPIHINIPKHMKNDLQKYIPKGTLSHLVRNFLRQYMFKMKNSKDNPMDGIVKSLTEKGENDG